MEIDEKEYEDLLKENQLFKGMIDTAIEEFLQLEEDHGILLINKRVLCNTYDTIFQCLKDRTLKK